MPTVERDDDFDVRRKHLQELSDEELHIRFWQLVDELMQPLIDEARTHTTPSIERSVLLRMGFSSVEAKALVEQATQRRLLDRGIGRLVLELARAQNVTIRQAGALLLDGKHWQEISACG